MVPRPASCEGGTLGDQMAAPDGGGGGSLVHPADEDQVGQLQPGITFRPPEHRFGKKAAGVSGIHPGA